MGLPIKVCTASAYFALMRGGGEHYTLYLCRKLKQLGYDIEIVCGRRPGRPPQPLTDEFPLHYVTQYYGLRELAFKGVRYVGGAAWKAHSLQYDLALRKYLKGSDFDLLHLHTPSNLATAVWLKRRKKVPIVYTLHGPASRKEKGMMRYLDHLMPVNTDIAEELRDDGFENVTVVPVGVDLEHFHCSKKNEGPERDGKTILFVGRLIPTKNVDGLLRAFKIVQSKVPMAKLVIVGEGPVQANLERMARELVPGVEFLGGLGWQQLPSRYCASDLFVLPSHYESFSMVGLEAAACGLPLVISEKAKAFVDSYGDDGVITFDPERPENIAEAILRGLEPEARHRMRLHAQRHISNYDWSTRAKVVDQVYREVLHQ
jgi:glycosyltransferase involved in cell wall biosynthesis